ncbi:MAG TPA: tRNA 2-thiouridine(34) synthase MnmA [Thermoanaerobaculia bacterium]|nr:tRNA 2-thiouridine(34) synthase MnmA [Thermoanaerobaculia bacterium]
MSTAILLSGGVDSSVALVRLLEAGVTDVTAFFLKVWLEEEVAGFGDCPWEEDLGVARAVCSSLGVPLEVVPLQREYRERIVAEALDDLRAGRTPSPDVLCNRRIKFGAFLETVGAGFDVVASGHYARVVEREGIRLLACAADRVKDQTYFLSQLTAEQLGRCRFPVGDLTKAAVRRIAASRGLPTAGRPDRQGLCFLGEIPFDAFVRAHLGDRPGEIREAGSGRRLGEHRGHWFYTLGQRKGLGLSGGPWFVTAKDVDDDVVWVTHADRLAEAAPDRFTVPSPHWISGPPELAGAAAELRVKVRHGPGSYACTVEPVPAPSPGSPRSGAFAVRLERPDPGLAPGQFAVFYRGDLCLGGGAMEPAPALVASAP